MCIITPPSRFFHIFGNMNEMTVMWRVLVLRVSTAPISRCCCSVTQLRPTLGDPWTVAHQASLSFTVYLSLLKLTSIESVMPSNHLILCLPLFLLPSIFPSIRVFSNESTLGIRWPRYWSFSFSISSFNVYSDWFPLVLTGLISLLSNEVSRIF